MVAQNFSLSAKFVTQKLSSIGITSESKDIMILNKDGELKRKKTRCYTVPNGAAWNEMAKRYLDQGSVEERIGNIPECPDVLKAKTYIE